jgi:hypothetical protein
MRDGSAMLRASSLALKFFVELAAFAAFAYWGASVASGAAAVALAIAAPAVAIAGWALFAAPKSERRLPRAPRVAFELSVFGLAIVALFAAGAPIAAVVLALLVATSALLLTRLDQWEA